MININLDRNSKVPFYIQIKEQIVNGIKNEEIKDLRLPTQRELSEYLNISRNTVSMAYSELEKEGIIQIFIGKGTFITNQGNSFQGLNKREILLSNIEHSIEEALGLGFSLDEYLTRIRKFIKEKKEMMKYVKLVFIECNIEQTNYYSTHLQLDPHIKIIPVVLFEIKNNNPNAIKKINNADLIVTSFYHISEIKKILKKHDNRIHAISLSPEMNTIVNIARVPATNSVGIITSSKQFMEDIIKCLKEIGAEFSEVFEFIEPSNFQLNKTLEKADTLIISPQWKKKIEQIIGKSKRKINLIEFIYTPDNTSINNLQIILFELRKNKKGYEHK